MIKLGPRVPVFVVILLPHKPNESLSLARAVASPFEIAFFAFTRPVKRSALPLGSGQYIPCQIANAIVLSRCGGTWRLLFFEMEKASIKHGVHARRSTPEQLHDLVLDPSRP